MTITNDTTRGFDIKIALPVTPVHSPARTIDRRLVHKTNDENVLLSHIEAVADPNEPQKVHWTKSILRTAARQFGQWEITRKLGMKLEAASSRTDHFRGVICIHRDHAFFFEHERAHIPGLYLMEAIRQMSMAVAHKFYNVAFELEFVLTDCSARFHHVANVEDSIIAEQALSRFTYRKGRLTSMYGTTTVRQGHFEIARLSGTMVFLSKSQLKYLEARSNKA
jgi:hypothetical protein